jgi:formate dehydrogenase subunit delta
MNIDHLTEMANQIGQFFAAYPDHQQSQREIAEHLKKFWEPRMRRALLAHLDASNGAGLDALVHDAVVAHRRMLEPLEPLEPPARSPQPPAA